MAREYKRHYQVLCEGDGDDKFIQALAKAHDLPEFEVTCFASGGGFEAKLASFEIPVNRGVIKKIVIVADNDTDPSASFQVIKKGIERCKIYPVPKRPRHIRGSEHASVAVLMLPGDDEHGNLETLFLKNVRVKHPELVTCAEAFCACERAGVADDWTKGQRDKMLLRSILSARIKDDPNSSLGFIWGKPDLPMDIGSDEFKWIADFMREFFEG